MEALLIPLLLIMAPMGLLGRWIGRPKGLSNQGFWLGALLGPFGVIIVGLMEKTPEAIAAEQRKVADAEWRLAGQLRAEEAAREKYRQAADEARRAQVAREAEQWQDFSVDPRKISWEAIVTSMDKLQRRHDELRGELLRRHAVHKAAREAQAARAAAASVPLARVTRVVEPPPIIPPALEALIDALADDPEAFPNGKPVSATAKKKA